MVLELTSGLLGYLHLHLQLQCGVAAAIFAVLPGLAALLLHHLHAAADMEWIITRKVAVRDPVRLVVRAAIRDLLEVAHGAGSGGEIL